MSELVCHIGVIGSGKDYKTQQLVKEGYVQVDFADALRDMAWSLLGWTPFNSEEYSLFKAGKIYIENFGYVNGRVFLQNLGSAMRKVDKDFWVKKWHEKVNWLLAEGKNVVCSDLRYVNEMIYAHLMPVSVSTRLVFCNYITPRYEPNNPHISERLAQKILANGYKDGDVLSSDYITSLLQGQKD